MKRFTDWFIWIPLIILMSLFFAGLFYSFIVGEPKAGVESHDWIGK